MSNRGHSQIQHRSVHMWVTFTLQFFVFPIGYDRALWISILAWDHLQYLSWGPCAARQMISRVHRPQWVRRPSRPPIISVLEVILGRRKYKHQPIWTCILGFLCSPRSAVPLACHLKHTWRTFSLRCHYQIKQKFLISYKLSSLVSC